jgi:hypothetical protein
LSDEIPAIKGKIAKVDDMIKDVETFMENFKQKYSKLKPGVHQQYEPTVAQIRKTYDNLQNGLKFFWQDL